MTASTNSPPDNFPSSSSIQERRSSDPDGVSQSTHKGAPSHSATLPAVLHADKENVLKHKRTSPSAPVPADRFYGKSSAHNIHSGSSRTSYIPPSPTDDSPPPLVQEPTDIVMRDDPNLPNYSTANDYSNLKDGWGEPETPWDNVDAFRNFNSWATIQTSSKVDIDGRDADEEERWWDADLRAQSKRPGPGMLPPLLSDLLHNPEHTLYSISASPPAARNSHSHSNSATSITASSSSPPQSQAPTHHPPTAEEVRMAVPHANAYYCKEHNGWVLLSWCSSTVLPPLARSFKPSAPFPDQIRRKRTQSCVGEGEQPFGQANKTHHFHRYERAVDARLLNTPYKRSEWEEEEARKRRRRKMSLRDEGEHLAQEAEEEEEGDLLDLYVCCQCSVYCLSSQVIPGVIPVKFTEELTKDKLSHPALGKTAHATVMAAWETFVTYVLSAAFLHLFSCNIQYCGEQAVQRRKPFTSCHGPEIPE